MEVSIQDILAVFSNFSTNVESEVTRIGRSKKLGFSANLGTAPVLQELWGRGVPGELS